jgi:putative metallohydrolase (TIGR04338 family)
MGQAMTGGNAWRGVFASLTPTGRGTKANPDKQRQRLYDAESIVPAGRTFETVAECQAFIDKVLASAFVRRRWGLHAIEVLDGRGHRNATGGSGAIQAPKWARNEAVLSHELAHCLAGSHAMHGPQFARVRLELTGHIFGAEVRAGLLKSYRGHRVKMAPPTKLRPSHRVPPAPTVTAVPFWRVFLVWHPLGTPKAAIRSETFGVEGYDAVGAVMEAIEQCGCGRARVVRAEIRSGRRTAADKDGKISKRIGKQRISITDQGRREVAAAFGR